jgi:hypothetical protein
MMKRVKRARKRSLFDRAASYFYRAGMTQNKRPTIPEMCRMAFRMTGEPYGESSSERYAYLAAFIRSKVDAPKAARRKDYGRFYESPEWLAVRYEALRLANGCCDLCGNTAQGSGSPLHVDHIKPRSLFPDLELSVNNLQVLCRGCNLGKGNRDSTDWRHLRTSRPLEARH